MKDKGPKAGGDPASATLGWFAMMGPVNGEIEAQMKRVQSFSSDVQTAYLEAFARHMESVNTANQRFAHLLQGLVQVRQPQEALVEAAELVAAFIEGTSDQSRTWVNFAQTLQDRCAAIAKETAAEMRRHTAEAVLPKPSA